MMKMSALAIVASAVSVKQQTYSLPLTNRAELHSREFVTCDDCPDFDLCLTCFAEGEHGHDPSHGFHETIEHSVDGEIKALCAPGRGVHHAAICDGCDKASITLAPLTHFINSTSRPLLEFVTSVCPAQTLTTARNV